MNIHGSFIVDIKDFGKVKFEKKINLQDRYGDYSSPKNHFTETTKWHYKNAVGIKLLQIEIEDELKDINNTFEIIEKYDKPHIKGTIYALVMGYDEQSFTKIIHDDKEAFYEKILSLLNDGPSGEMVIETWKNGEKLSSEWIAGCR